MIYVICLPSTKLCLKSIPASAGCPTFCPAVYAAICGTDGKTYDSECQLKTETCKTGNVIFVDYEGECVNTSGRQKQQDSKSKF